MFEKNAGSKKPPPYHPAKLNGLSLRVVQITGNSIYRTNHIILWWTSYSYKSFFRCKSFQHTDRLTGQDCLCSQCASIKLQNYIKSILHDELRQHAFSFLQSQLKFEYVSIEGCNPSSK